MSWQVAGLLVVAWVSGLVTGIIIYRHRIIRLYQTNRPAFEASLLKQIIKNESNKL